MGSDPTYMALSGRPLKVAITLAVIFGFMLIGYDPGCMSSLMSTEVFLETFPMLENPTLSGFVSAIYDIGCFLGALFSFFHGDRLGRRRTIILGAIFNVMGVAIQITSLESESNPDAPLIQFIVGRVILGLGNGIIISTCPTYQSECQDQAHRGLAVCVGAGSVPYGTFLSYWLNVGLQNWETDFIWRFPISFQLVFTFSLLTLMIFLPESPRWLLCKDEIDEGTRVIAALNGESLNGEKTMMVRGTILESTVIEKAVNAGSDHVGMFTGGQSQHFRRMLIGVSSQFFQQIGGCNAVLYYVPTLLRNSLGMDQHTAMLIGGVAMAVYAVFGSVTSFFIEYAGRRPLFLIGTSGQMIAMAIIGVCLIPGTPEVGMGSVVGLFIFIISFASSYLTVPWLYAVEINPLTTRAQAAASANVANWLTNFLIVMITPIMMNTIGWGTYIFFAVMNACFLPVIWLFYPETKGRSLEDIDSIFAKGFNENISYVKAAKYMGSPYHDDDDSDMEALNLSDYGFSIWQVSNSSSIEKPEAVHLQMF